jgi:hypothetical protein
VNALLARARAELFEAALAYSGSINDKLSDLPNDMTGIGDIDLWRGPAKLSYEKRVADQKDAVTASVKKVQDSSSWLAMVAAENTTYMTELGERVSSIIGQLVTVCVDIGETLSGAVTQAVVTLGDFSEILGELTTQLMQYALGLAKRLADVVSQVNELEISRHDKSGLGGGKWPAAAAGLSS